MEARKPPKMITFKGTRYRENDAKRLGIVADGKVVTARSVEVQRTTNAPLAGDQGPADGLLTTETHEGTTPPENGPQKPNKGASKADWVEYATAHGVADAESMKRNDIADLFND